VSSFLNPAGPLSRLKGGSSRQSGESSETYDHSGLAEHIKRQDAVDSLRGSKFAANYQGDIPSAVEAGNRVRNAVAGLREVTPDATERDPHKLKMPLVVVRSRSSSGSLSSDGPEAAWGDPEQGPPLPGVEVVRRRDGILGGMGQPERFAGQA
jgi:hypothetical protein